METKRQHFVQYLSPGTLFSETTQKPIDSWDIPTAVKMAADIMERHGAKPYGFQFLTKIVADAVDDGEGGQLSVAPKTVEQSGNHFLTGEIQLYDDVAATQENSILRSNMRGNRWPVLVINRNSYRFTCQFEADDCIVDMEGSVVRRGNDPELTEYRERKIAEWEDRKVYA